jgi:ssDNA-binding Zn-finger/Zn-ribbon topoisomerase 1
MLGVFENRVLRKCFACKGEKLTGSWGRIRSFIICTLYPKFHGLSNDTSVTWT